MRVRNLRGLIVLSVSFLLFQSSVQSGPVFNYQGRITAGATPHDGAGWFKFALIDSHDGFVWSNDGTAGQPFASVVLQVRDGLFGVDLGDTSVAGMVPIPPLALHRTELNLRVWFSVDGIVFEQLSPDTPLRPLNFSAFNTGRMVIVESGGHGDFDNLQDAINRVVDDHGYDAILVMPGNYPGPIVIPDNKSRITIRGAAHVSSVRIWNDEGAAISCGEGTEAIFENLSIFGVPALSDSGVVESGSLTFSHCELAVPSGSSGPAIDLSGPGQLTLADSLVFNSGTGSALRITGSAFVEAERSRFDVADGPAVLLRSASPHIRMVNCVFRSDNDVALLIDQGSQGWGSFNLCRFESGITADSSGMGMDFNQCEVRGTFSVENNAGGHFNFFGCNIGNQDDASAVRMIGGRPNASFRSCRFHSSNTTTFYMEDAPGWVSLDSCNLQAANASAFEMVAGPGIILQEGQDMWGVQIRDSLISAHAQQEGATAPAVRLSNTSGGGEGGLDLDISLFGSQIHGSIRDGAEIGPGCELSAQSSIISGGRHGIYAPAGADIELVECTIYGATDEPGAGVYMGGSGFVFIQGGQLIGEDEGVGLFLDFSEGGAAIIAQSLIGGFGGSALTATGGDVFANQATFISLAYPMLSLAGTNANLRFNHCTFKSIVDLLDENELTELGIIDSPAVVLSGAQDQTPVPIFFACSFEPSPDAEVSIALSEATSGQIGLINSQLTKPLQSFITNAAPPSDDRGNVVFTP